RCSSVFGGDRAYLDLHFAGVDIPFHTGQHGTRHARRNALKIGEHSPCSINRNADRELIVDLQRFSSIVGRSMPTAPDGRQQPNNASLGSQVTPVPVRAEPVTAEAARRVRRALLTQHWLDLAFLHWPVDPDAVAPLLPAGTRPDQFGGTSYVGLIAFRMYRIGWLGLPGLPYLGSFPGN